MNNSLTPERISDVLFTHDPLQTACKENDCFDEYDFIAYGVAKRLNRGEALEAALKQALLDSFGQALAGNVELAQVVNDLHKPAP